MQNGRVEKLHGSPLLRHVDIIADPELLVKLAVWHTYNSYRFKYFS
jgi:hypothetical protein